jgi:hypothetical protein
LKARIGLREKPFSLTNAAKSGHGDVAASLFDLGLVRYWKSEQILHSSIALNNNSHLLFFGSNLSSVTLIVDNALRQPHQQKKDGRILLLADQKATPWIVKLDQDMSDR